MKRPQTINGTWEYGDWHDQLMDFRETFEYLDDPENDIDELLRERAEQFGHQQQSYQAYLESSYWQSVRSKVLARANGYCESCGAEADLQVHHKQYCPRYSEHKHLHLLEALCESCHSQSHQ
jgi:5-methylcytosine-specific restriction endonuclease McrA